MKAKTLTALQESIEHWEANIADPENASISGEDCALCDLFVATVEDTDAWCNGCPVAEETGRQQCRNSPWDTASATFWRWCKEGMKRDQYRASFVGAARGELEFLKRLLPDGE